MSADSMAPSVDPQEVAYFERLAHRWWDTEGPFWPLHRLNAFRTNYIRGQLTALFDRDPATAQPFSGLRLLDIGCGGGILSEALARLGAEVTGIDVTDKNIRVAQWHAQDSGLRIDYRCISAEALATSGVQYDAVLNLEVIEHVEDLPSFIATCGELVRPGGAMVVSSINRTPLAWLIAIIGAEYILRWLPRGTHHYRKLARPQEVRAGLGADFSSVHATGVRVNPFNRRFDYTDSLAVNYMLVMRKRLGEPAAT